MSGWSYVIIAGLLEIGFTTCMKLAKGSYTSPWFFAFIPFTVLSFYCLNLSLREIPLGTAYAVWTGIGAVGTVVVGILFFGDSSSLIRILLLVNIVGSIVGLKLLA